MTVLINSTYSKNFLIQFGLAIKAYAIKIDPIGAKKTTKSTNTKPTANTNLVTIFIIAHYLVELRSWPSPQSVQMPFPVVPLYD